MRRDTNILVKRGDVFSCKARRGYTRVKVHHVNPHGPWVSVTRVDDNGKRLHGRFTVGPLAGCHRGESFDVYLTNGGDGTNRMRMPNGYSKVAQ